MTLPICSVIRGRLGPGWLALGLLALVACSARDSDRTAKPPGATPATTSEADSTFEIPDIPIDEMPKLLQSPVVYPEEAMRRGEEGLVQVKALIGKDGRVRTASLDAPRPTPDYLGPAAVEAVRQWTFEPARAKGEPVAVWIVVPVNYRLR